MVHTIARFYYLKNHCEMGINWDTVVPRLSKSGPDGGLLSATTEEETDKELRAMIVRLARECPLGRHHARSPFGALRHPCHFSWQNRLDSLSRKIRMGLFELEWEVGNTAAATGPHAGGISAAEASAAA